ncbi:alkaline phosphatase D family protein [Amycolatopsis pithecellobii]|uniref:Alkaline phosphatase n=1 Tax=Amycolatopsis pithecellobii TaxID=664692 RepID=A0A6N7Z6C8_9PSEU|nr:alkaline phosphatase D family protein [Amycolatopsis pithecellobii]MTD56414.1 alkaline phosphatase [Amycolatopsis pithecellobii]
MPPEFTPTRRRVLIGGAAALGAAALAGVAMPTGRHGQFSLGVASGDPLPDGVMLWTRLAPDPLAPDGGMTGDGVPVEWQVATDERFATIVRSGVTTALAAEAHSVHVAVSGLRPGAEYFYRFRAGGELSPVGRTRTAPAPGARVDRFSFAFASCQRYPDGFYNAYDHLAREDVDLVVFLGDYIYEGGSQGRIGRGHRPDHQLATLADYRIRFAQYKSDPALQAVHAAFPWIPVFDDHEVENNWAGDRSESGIPVPEFRARRAGAFQAYWEHQPLRARPAGPSLLIHRRLTFGDLVDFHVLDTRQYRSAQVPEAQRGNPGRTILGAQQKAWLFANLAASQARWNVLAQQVFFSQLNPAPGWQTRNDDAWDDYLPEREEVRDHLATTRNPVVITGDAHCGYVCDIKADFDNPLSRTVGAEFVGTSITSEGDGVDRTPGDIAQLRVNPHIRFVNRKRGYVRCSVTPDSLVADYRAVDYVSRPGSPVGTLGRFVIVSDEPGARQIF